MLDSFQIALQGFLQDQPQLGQQLAHRHQPKPYAKFLLINYSTAIAHVHKPKPMPYCRGSQPLAHRNIWRYHTLRTRLGLNCFQHWRKHHGRLDTFHLTFPLRRSCLLHTRSPCPVGSEVHISLSSLSTPNLGMRSTISPSII